MNERQKVGVFMDYMEKQGGVVPSSVAAVYLRITPQGVNSAIQRGKLGAVKWRGNFYIGKKTLNNYRWFNATRFKDNAPGHVQNHLRDLDADTSLEL